MDADEAYTRQWLRQHSPCKWEAHMPPPPIKSDDGRMLYLGYTHPRGLKEMKDG